MAVQGINVDLVFNDLVSNLETKFASDRQYSDILDWYDNGGVDKEALGIELTAQQRLVLATYYGIELTEEQQSILEFWKAQDRTTYDFDFGPTKRQNLVCEAGRRGGKCSDFNSLHLSQEYGMIYGYELLGHIMGVKRESQLLTAEGMKKLADEHKLADTALSIKETVAIEGKSKTAQTDAMYVKGMSKTKKVTTACGYNLEATPEHRVKIMTADGVIDWVYFSDIKVGDYVSIHRNTDLFPSKYLLLDDYLADALDYSEKARSLTCNNEILDKDFGYLLGLLTANGSWTSVAGLQLTHHVQDAENYLNALIKGMKRLGLDQYIKSGQHTANGMHTDCNSKNLRKLFDNLGFTVESRVNKKKTPWSIRQSPKDVQAAYLSGLFDGDGSVEKGWRCITLSTASKTLAAETQLLLLNFGIVSRVKEKIVKGKPYYLLTLRGQRSLKVFASEIGFKLERKQSVVKDYLSNTGRDGGDTERIPHQVKWLQRIRDLLPTNIGKQPGSHGLKTEKLRNLREEYRVIVGNAGKTGSKELLSSYRLDKLIKFAEQFSDDLEAIQHFKHIRECDYFYDPVVSVEDSEAFCVDLSVPGYEQYVAQGMTNHNTLLGALIVNYEFELLCRMESPQKHYGIASNTLISMICLATSSESSTKTIYGQARAMMKHNVPYLKKLIAKGAIEVQEKQIKYEDKLLYIYSGNSKSETQVGGSPILIVLDEGALFEDKDGQSNALILWDNLGAGGLIFREDAKRCIISSAWKTGDALEVLYGSSKESQGWIGFRLRSWDLNPIFAARDNPVIDSMYIRDRAMAELLFEGIRSSNANLYFQEAPVKAAFNHMSDLYAVELPIQDDKLVRLQINEVGPYDGRTIMHLDPAVLHDAYALAYGHSYIYEKQLHVVIDGILAWQPKAGAQVSILNVQQAIYQIHLQRPLYRVTSDPKESAETLQRLRTSGITTEMITFSNPKQLAMYDVVRKLANEGRLHLPKNSPWTGVLREELLRLELLQTKVAGQAKIDHPSGGSKDISDCVAAVCYQLAADSFENSFEPGTASVVLANSSRKDNPALLNTEEAGLFYTFSKDTFMKDLKRRKKSWNGLSSVSSYR